MNPMETRVAVLGIIVDDIDATAALNKILHSYADYVIGRMGIPYPKRKISIISVVALLQFQQITILIIKPEEVFGMFNDTIRCARSQIKRILVDAEVGRHTGSIGKVERIAAYTERHITTLLIYPNSLKHLLCRLIVGQR